MATQDGYYNKDNEWQTKESVWHQVLAFNDNLVELINPSFTNLTLIKPFKFKISSQDVFQNKIDQLRDQYGADISLEVYTGKGETL